MKIYITGSTGFVGSKLVPILIEKGHEIILLLRRGEEKKFDKFEVDKHIGDPNQPGEHWKALEVSDLAINLAGYPVFKRWTKKRKKLIRESRIRTTINLVNSIPKEKEFCLINASGIGIYGDCKDEVLEENHSLGTDYLARVATAWEEVAASSQKGQTRVALARFGIILGSTGGAFPEMVKSIQRFGIGPIGSGQQWFPWIHIDDVVGGIIHIIENPSCSGPYNFTAPNPQRQKNVAKIAGEKLHRPAIIPVPSHLLKLVLGEFAGVAMGSQRALPTRLLESGYTFRHPDLPMAIDEILSETSKT